MIVRHVSVQEVVRKKEKDKMVYSPWVCGVSNLAL